MSACVAMTFAEMCRREGLYVQRGMYWRARPGRSLVFISSRGRSGYTDHTALNGAFIVYEGHNAMRHRAAPLPQLVDQPIRTRSGNPTVNGRFLDAASAYRSGLAPAETIHVYRKLGGGVWLFLGPHLLVDGWTESDGRRLVCKFKLKPATGYAGRDTVDLVRSDAASVAAPRAIPAGVRARVWNRDGGRCVVCGATENLHFDHIVPASKGGSSATAKNVRLLCAAHNLAKSDRLDR
ncbi:HNH endonuclease [bacterium]|nr:HNH endonuclease [bacterium]